MTKSNAQTHHHWLDEAKDRLYQWGREEWKQRKGDGFPSETIEYVAMRYGGQNPSATGYRKEGEAPDIEETDRIVSQLSEISKDGEKIRAAVYVYYVHRVSMGKGGYLMRCSKSHFQRMLERGQDRVAAGLMYGRRV